MLPCPDCCAGVALGVRDVLLTAVAAATALLLLAAGGTYHRCCAVLLLLLTQLPSWSRSVCDMFCCKTSRVWFIYLFIFCLTYTFQLLDNKPWPPVSSLLPPPGECIHFFGEEGSSFPTLVDCSNFSSSRAVGSSCFYAIKSPYEHEHALGETRTHTSTKK